MNEYWQKLKRHRTMNFWSKPTNTERRVENVLNEKTEREAAVQAVAVVIAAVYYLP